MNILLNPIIIFKRLTYFICGLFILNLVDIFIRFYMGYGGALAFISQFFSFDSDNSIPNFYSSLALFTSALLLLFISVVNKNKRMDSLMWLGLSFIFIFLALDETIQFHEKLSWIVQKKINTSGMFWFVWVIPYSIITLIIFSLYFKFLLRLRKRFRFLIVLAGVIFVLGAVGFEMIESNRFFKNKELDITYYLYVSVEEFLEMFGIILFIYALLLYIKIELNIISIKINH